MPDFEASFDSGPATTTIQVLTNTPSMRFREITLDYTRLFYMLYINLDTQINLAETKANLVIGANAILVAASVWDQGAIRAAFGKDGSLLAQFAVAFSTLMILGVIASIATALRVSVPRMAKSQRTKDFYYFGHIQSMSEADFVKGFMEMTGEDIKHAILGQIHTRATIVQRKFENVRLSMICLTFSVAMFVISQSLLAIAN